MTTARLVTPPISREDRASISRARGQIIILKALTTRHQRGQISDATWQAAIVRCRERVVGHQGRCRDEDAKARIGRMLERVVRLAEISIDPTSAPS